MYIDNSNLPDTSLISIINQTYLQNYKNNVRVRGVYLGPWQTLMIKLSSKNCSIIDVWQGSIPSVCCASPKHYVYWAFIAILQNINYVFPQSSNKKFSTSANCSEKTNILAPWYVYVCVSRVRMLVFGKKCRTY